MSVEISHGFPVAWFLLGFIVDVGFMLAALARFRELVDHEYLNYPEHWQKDGKPGGGRITRRAIGFRDLSSQVAAGSLWLEWYRRTPPWAVGDIKAMSCLKRFRRLVTVSFVISVVLALSGLWISRRILSMGLS